MSRHATAEDLSAYLDREMEPIRLRLVKEHLEECEECRERAGGMQRLVRDLRRLERLEPPPTLGSSLRRRIRLQKRPKAMVDRLESRLGGLSLQPSITFTFALVFAFAAILYLFAGSLDRYERLRIPVLRPDPAPAQPSATREVAGRSFHSVDGIWREEGLAAGTEAQTVALGTPAADELLRRYPDLGSLLADGGAVELYEGTQALRLEASPEGEPSGGELKNP